MKVDEIEVLVTGDFTQCGGLSPKLKEVKMTLVEGRVEVKTEEHRQLLSPDEQALVDKQEGQIRVRKREVHCFRRVLSAGPGENSVLRGRGWKR